MTIPSLSTAFANLLKPLTSGFAAPAKPNVSSYTSVGVSSPAALAAAKTPAVPNMSVYTPPRTISTPAQIAATNAANPHTGANASYVNPANATASKGTVPYIPSGVNGGGKSAVPTMTSVATGKPSAPGAVTPSNIAPYTPPPAPAMTPKQQTAAASTASTPALPSFSSSSTPSSTSSFSAPASPSFGGGTPSFGGASQTPFYTPSASTYSSGNGSLPMGWDQGTFDSFKAANPDLFPNEEDTKKMQNGVGLGLFTSPEQQAAEQAYQAALKLSPEEEDTQKKLNALNASAATAYTNTAGQPIPLAFITGQQKNLQASQAALAQPLESQLALLQAKRQLAGEASKTALDQANARIAAFRDFNKPVAATPGTNLINPLTGATIASGGSLADKNALDTFFNLQQSYPDAAIAWDPKKSAQQNLQDAQAATSNSATYQAKSTTIRSVQLPGGGLGFYNSKDGNIYDGSGNVVGNIGSAGNPTIGYTGAQGATAKADAASLTKQQEYADSTERAFNTANNNLTALTGWMTSAGINQSDVPIVNQLTNKVKAKLVDPGAVASYQAALSGLRAEYALVLSRGGEVTEGQRAQASSLIPDTLSPAQLAQVAVRLNVEGGNAIKEARAQVTAIQSRMSTSAPSNFGVPSGGGSSSGVPAGWTW